MPNNSLFSHNTFVVGLTGGIGSGKTSVGRLLTHYYVPVIDADKISHQVTDSDTIVLNQLRKLFGSSIFDNNDTLNRKLLGELVFAHKEARMQLNSIIHPRILEIINTQIKKLATGDNPIVVVDAALIYEIKIEDMFHKIIVVFAPLEQRLARIRQRDKLLDENILERINAQMSLDTKVKRADYVVYNHKSLLALRHQVRKLYTWLKLQNRFD
jgi:dephospho-CoA kinase